MTTPTPQPHYKLKTDIQSLLRLANIRNEQNNKLPEVYDDLSVPSNADRCETPVLAYDIKRGLKIPLLKFAQYRSLRIAYTQICCSMFFDALASPFATESSFYKCAFVERFIDFDINHNIRLYFKFRGQWIVSVHGEPIATKKTFEVAGSFKLDMQQNRFVLDRPVLVCDQGHKLWKEVSWRGLKAYVLSMVRYLPNLAMAAWASLMSSRRGLASPRVARLFDSAKKVKPNQNNLES